MRTMLTVFVAALHVVSCATLQLVSPHPDRALELYQAPANYRQSGKPALNTIIIKSKPYNVSETKNDTNTWRRNIFIQKGEEISEENKNEPRLPQYTVDCLDEKTCSQTIHGESTPEPTFKPYSQEELDKFLEQYAAANGKPPGVDDSEPTNKLANLYMDEEEVINVLETTSKPPEHDPKSASWHLIQSQTHNHPYDDQKGWVTLEPVPWAQSQIQKWEPHTKPEIPPWDSSGHHHHSSHWNSKPQHEYSTERPWAKPTYEYKPSRPQNWNQDPTWNRPPEYPERPSHWGGNPDIITDNRPGYFPSTRPNQKPWYDQDSYSSNRPTQVVYHDKQGHPSTHPSEGDGQWVLLSSTKGYSVPHRHRGEYQRSMTFQAKAPASMSSHRTVRLTVLPAANSTNTTTSHGGLLEVESTFQTVDEAQREHAAKMMNLDNIKLNSIRSSAAPEALRSNSRSSEQIQIYTSATNPSHSRSAVLAAIGAGMIPATMAMLLPMVLGRRKRNADVYETTEFERMHTLLKPRKQRNLFKKKAAYKVVHY